MSIYSKIFQTDFQLLDKNIMMVDGVKYKLNITVTRDLKLQSRMLNHSGQSSYYPFCLCYWDSRFPLQGKPLRTLDNYNEIVTTSMINPNNLSGRH